MQPQLHAFCARCGTAIAPAMLTCPNCRQLVFAEELEQIAAQAKEAETVGKLERARELWAGAMAYLPPESVQWKTIHDHVASFNAPPAPGRSIWKKLLGTGAVAGGAAWKFKTFLLLILSKVKFLLFGFTKAGSLLSMFASFGLYLTLYSWPFALGFVLSIYLHEMGHVAAFRHYGIPVSAPMFIPGFGAFVRGNWMPKDLGQNARISLAGPMWGLYAAVACFAMAAWTGETIWSALATVGAQINLLNLIPVFILDGGGAVKALPMAHRIAMAALTLAGFLGMGVGLYFLVFLGMGYQLWKKEYPEKPDWGVTIQYAGLLGALGVMCLVPVDTAAIR